MCSSAYYRDHRGIWRRVGWSSRADPIEEDGRTMAWTPGMDALLARKTPAEREAITGVKAWLKERGEREEIEARECAVEIRRRERQRLMDQEWERAMARQNRERARQAESAETAMFLRPMVSITDQLLSDDQDPQPAQEPDSIEDLCAKAQLVWGL
jgi:hypothetical protein